MHLFYRINSTFEAVDELVDGVMDFLYHICHVTDAFRLNIINFGLRELLINAVEHGNGFDEKKYVVCDFYYKHNGVHIRVKDEGQGFQMDSFLNSCVINDISRERIRGICILIKLGYDLLPRGNQIDAILKWPENK